MLPRKKIRKRFKKRGSKPGREYKICVRLLPPNLTEEQFLETLEQHNVSTNVFKDSFYYVQGHYSSKIFKRQTLSRAYIQLDSLETIESLYKTIKTCRFVDDLENSMVPDVQICSFIKKLHGPNEVNPLQGTILKDHVFQTFMKSWKLINEDETNSLKFKELSIITPLRKELEREQKMEREQTERKQKALIELAGDPSSKEKKKLKKLKKKLKLLEKKKSKKKLKILKKNDASAPGGSVEKIESESSSVKDEKSQSKRKLKRKSKLKSKTKEGSKDDTKFNDSKTSDTKASIKETKLTDKPRKKNVIKKKEDVPSQTGEAEPSAKKKKKGRKPKAISDNDTDRKIDPIPSEIPGKLSSKKIPKVKSKPKKSPEDVSEKTAKPESKREESNKKPGSIPSMNKRKRKYKKPATANSEA